MQVKPPLHKDSRSAPGVAGYGIYPCVGVEELAMVPMCWGGGAGYGTHVLGWRSWLWYPCMGWRSWLWYPCVGVEELAMVPMCWGVVAGYGTHVLGYRVE